MEGAAEAPVRSMLNGISIICIICCLINIKYNYLLIIEHYNKKKVQIRRLGTIFSNNFNLYMFFVMLLHYYISKLFIVFYTL